MPVQGDRRGAAPQQPRMEIPAKLTIREGTLITVRVDQPVSSDRNQPGDPFSAILVRPVVVDGVVVAERGQTLTGRVVEAQKAGKVKGVSRLAVELAELTLPDGQTKSNGVAWSLTGRGPYMPTPLAYQGILYVLANNGVFDAYDLQTGQEIYRQRLPEAGSGFSASKRESKS